MLEHSFDYSQMCVHRKLLSKPFNKWTKRERNQGFAYREGSVTFLLTSSFGDFIIDVHLGPREIDEKSIVVVNVPFNVRQGDTICVSAISDNLGDEADLEVPAGLYSLRYEGFPVIGDEEYEEKQFVKITFCIEDDPKFEVIRHTSDMNPPPTLHTDGEEA